MNTFKEDIVTTKQIRNKTIVPFVFFILFFVGCFYSWRWLHHQPKDNDIPTTLRTALNKNEAVFGYFFSAKNLLKTYPKSAAEKKVRVNGTAGMTENFDVASWKLQLVKNAGDTQYITLDEIKKLPKTEIVFDFKCIEGWSQVTHWGGVKFSDFVEKYGLTQQCKLNYVGLNTPDKEYYVGIDTRSMLHPQTLLCYEMNGAALPFDQGAPLRLIIPVKYGVKHIKRIGTLFFSASRPADYWFEKGYDYYCGF
jgi:DMSO/TMAO reductase YedYZ molybdopterin-dependent catalytic subunit